MNTPNAPICATTEQPGTSRLPFFALLIIALAGFVLIASETLPAGLLPQIAAGLHISEAMAGQLVSVYALGTVIAAIPATATTRGARRKPIALFGLAGILVANVVTAVSPNIALTLGIRAFAGACSGLLWGMLAGYARRISPPAQVGRALAIASIGVPTGLAAGTPLGSWMGSAFGWRYSFAALAVLSLATIILAVLVVPDTPGQPAASRVPVIRVLAIPGVGLILLVILLWMVAHNAFYTYISNYLQFAHAGLSTQTALVLFGVASIVGVWITGSLIDRALRLLLLLSIATFVVAATVLALAHGSLVMIVPAVALWGIAFGGAAIQLQTAMADASGENADVANSLLGVAFNIAIFTGGVTGAVLITHVGSQSLPVLMLALAALAFLVALGARGSGFPPRDPKPATEPAANIGA
ncbi:MFS transporter [Mycolicibacterium fluoranthenivorans]|uniref:Predicted arabinose efflux permease, MFS family n=1 Tax=Mycolicibacterium fluoranthenivorans TaxID=258505 RepID=A0A1G4WA38_9MYCO|nr:MFS transporter [Mycolicibacterium fluoranthenivorans]SCX19254.1 Predicted arabinose efflux permease, MFS family [Mycolicibacterium fluoranthenivorans]